MRPEAFTEDVRFTPMGETGYLTARYPGRDGAAKPIVVLAHMDVVGVERPPGRGEGRCGHLMAMVAID